MPSVHSLGNTEKMMRFLESGRADVALTNTVDGNLILKKLGLSSIVPSDKPLAVLELYHYIHEKHRGLVPRVDAVIKEMKASGELAALIKKAEKQVIEKLLHG